jgi:hypothetical protein
MQKRVNLHHGEAEHYIEFLPSTRTCPDFVCSAYDSLTSSGTVVLLRGASWLVARLAHRILPPADLQASDARRRQIQLLDEAIGDPERVMRNPEESLADCHALLLVLEEVSRAVLAY